MDLLTREVIDTLVDERYYHLGYPDELRTHDIQHLLGEDYEKLINGLMEYMPTNQELGAMVSHIDLYLQEFFMPYREYVPTNEHYFPVQYNGYDYYKICDIVRTLELDPRFFEPMVQRMWYLVNMEFHFVEYDLPLGDFLNDKERMQQVKDYIHTFVNSLTLLQELPQMIADQVNTLNEAYILQYSLEGKQRLIDYLCKQIALGGVPFVDGLTTNTAYIFAEVDQAYHYPLLWSKGAKLGPFCLEEGNEE